MKGNSSTHNKKIGGGALKIGWFSTGRDEEARRLLTETLREIESGLIKLDIAFVFCNREEGESVESDRFIRFVREKGLELHTFSSSKFLPELWKNDRDLWRELYHQKVWELTSPYDVSFSMLAGYMLIVGNYLIERHTMLNLHPAPPGGPKGAWQDVMWSLIEGDAEETGAQIHIVTPVLDEGAPLTFCKFNIKTPEYQPLWNEWKVKKRSEDNLLFKKIREEEFRREIPLILLTLRLLGEGEIIIRDGEVYSPEGIPLKGGLDISERVEKYIKRRCQKGTRSL